MRVISGEKKGLHLKAVPGQSTRPTTDKVKESIFNIIGPYFDGGKMLDLYGGSGSISIEALSRGMERAIIVDKDKKAIETIYTNLKFCCLEDRAEVYRNEAIRALKALKKKEESFLFIFLDPPYQKQKIAEELLFIDEHALLLKEGFIVVEHASNVELESTYGNLERKRDEQYGDTTISIYHYDNEKRGM